VTTATHGLVVNGNNQGQVSYPVTGRDNWQQSSVSVTLKAGWNTIRLIKGTAFTEVDYLELQ
jgi:arabinan endo-1,5-alpha-L-arabinosidase